MKFAVKILTFVLGLSISAQAMAGIKIPKGMHKKVCEMVAHQVEHGYLDTDVEYSFDRCMDDGSFDVSEQYDPDGKELYDIDFSSGELIEGSDLWLSCEILVEGSLSKGRYEMSYCSVEQ